MKHGVCKVNQTTGIRQTGALVNGQYHGPLSFWHSSGKVENVIFNAGKEVKRGGRVDAANAFYTRDGGVVNARNSNLYAFV